MAVFELAGYYHEFEDLALHSPRAISVAVHGASEEVVESENDEVVELENDVALVHFLMKQVEE